MIVTKLLDSQDLIDDAKALLYNEYVKTDIWVFSENNPSELKVIAQKNINMLVDRIDKYAVWFGAFDNKKLVGCIRLFKASDTVPFEIEMYPTAQGVVEQYIKENKPNIYEGTRACVSSDYKGKGILTKLYLAILEYAQKEKAAIFGTASNGYIKSILKRIEWPCKKEDGFKFEESDPSPVNFYLVHYKEIGNIIDKIKQLDSIRNRENMNILSALEMVAPIFPAPMYWHDINGVVLGMNTRCLNAMGRSKDEVLGKTPYDFYPKEVAEYIWEHSNRVIRSGETLSQEEYAYDEFGKCVGIYLAIKAPLYDNNSDMIGIVGTSIDITAEKEAEQLRTQIKQHKALEAKNKLFADFTEQLLSVINNFQILNDKGESELNIEDITNNNIKLTSRENEVLYYLSRGKKPKDIAIKLGISHKTVQNIVDGKLFKKLETHNIGDLIEKAYMLKLVPLTV